MRRMRTAVGAIVAGGLVLGVAISAQGRSASEPLPRVYAASAPRVLVVAQTTPLRPPLPVIGRPPPGTPDSNDPWTGEPIAVTRVIGNLAADRTDPWTGVAIAAPPARGPMTDDHPFDAEASAAEARLAMNARRAMANDVDAFR